MKSYQWSVHGIILIAFCVGATQAQFFPIFDWVRSFFGQYEEPPYTSVRNISYDIEERVYASAKWVCCEHFFTPDVKDSKISEMFMTLYRYIQGKNEAGQKIGMTIPVATKVDHRNGKLRSYEMCLYLPSEFQDSPPKPVDNKVKIIQYPQLRIYSKRYGGYSTQEMELEQFQMLSQILKNGSISYFEESQGDRATYFVNGYDSPTKFWSRRNEVWLLSADTPKDINNHFTVHQ